MSSLRIYLFGSLRVELNDQAVAFPRRKTTVLLTYLAVTQQPHTRDVLATLFWPNHDQSGARANLRRALHVLLGGMSGWRLRASRLG